MAVITQSPIGTSPINMLRIIGAFVTIFSLAMGLLVWFVIPGACSFVSGFQLLILSFLFVLGGIAFLVGTAFSWKRRKT